MWNYIFAIVTLSQAT